MRKRTIAQRAKRSTAVALVVFLMLGSFAGGHVSGLLAQPALASGEPAEFSIFWEAWEVVVDHFVDRDKVDFQAMTYGAIEGMLASLGDEGHTTFLTPAAVERQQSDLAGSFEGIGAYVAMEGDEVTIVAPIEGSPAEEAGLLPGDVILAVDGESVAGLSLNDVISRIKGEAGTTVILTVLHPGSEESVDLSITRGKIQIDSVSWSFIPGTNLAYVRISQFAARTGQELEEALQAIQAADDGNAPVEGIVLDLRNNPGGFLREAIRVSSHFLPAGSTVLLERDGDANLSTHRARGWGLARDIPLVVLINEGTASAGEITAGALKENDRATLVGQTTFGTGTVLNQFTLSDGSAILLGVTNWLTPNGNLIKGQGIEPGIAVEMAASAPQVSAGSLPDFSAAELAESEDLQFLSALEQFGVELQPALGIDEMLQQTQIQ